MERKTVFALAMDWKFGEPYDPLLQITQSLGEHLSGNDVIKIRDGFPGDTLMGSIAGIKRYSNGKRRVFIDRKIFGTDDELISAIQSHVCARADFTTLCAMSGAVAMKKAVAAAQAIRKDFTPIGVGVPTTQPERETERIFGMSRAKAIVHTAALVRDAGIFHFVCARQDILRLRQEKHLDEMRYKVAGIRSKSENVAAIPGDTQVFTSTAAEAVLSGADWLIIGRPIMRAQNRPKALLAHIEEVMRAEEKLLSQSSQSS